MTEPNHKKGLQSLIILARLNQIALDEAQIDHTFALNGEDPSGDEILLIGKKSNLKMRRVQVKADGLSKLPLPALMGDTDGGFVVLARMEEGKALILDPTKGMPEQLEGEALEKRFTGEVILCKHKDMTMQHIKFGLRWFIPTVVKYKKALIDVLIAAFALQLIGLVSPMIMQVIIDKVLMHKGFTTLKVLMVGLLIIITFEMLLNLAKNYVFTHTTNRIDVILSARLFDHLFKLPLRYFEVRRVGDTIARVREVENIRRFLTGTPLSSILDVLFLIVYILVMFLYSNTLTWIVLASLPLFAILSIVITPLFKTQLEEKFRTGADMQSFLVENVSGVQTIKSFALEPLTQKRWEDKVAGYVDASFKTAIISGNAGAVGQYIQRGTDLVLLWTGVHLVISGAITVGQFIAFRMLSSQVSGPILRLVNLWQEFQQTAVSLERLGDIFNAQPEPSSDMQKMRLPAIQGIIEFQSVTFRYRMDAPEAVRNMSFKVPPGKVIGIVGRSGSGKSTLSKLIQRLYVPEGGKILIDGHDIALADPHWLRRQIGVVLQENFLFGGTVKDNICIHKPAATMEEIIHCAHMAGAHDFILELPEGYDTQVGEKGAALSGGQRQRLAIARALLSNPRILIFDEATSALDYESENIIQKNLSTICQGRTVLIIAHRLSTLRSADAIMVLDKGNLIEYGPEKALLAHDGLYKHLYNQQFGGETEEQVKPHYHPPTQGQTPDHGQNLNDGQTPDPVETETETESSTEVTA